jgi:ABC-type nitrate/sulfonate/bicarbonate transport system substrate-binding protein
MNNLPAKLCGMVLLLCVISTPLRANEKVTYVGPTNISVPFIVAEGKGYFAEEGLDVDYQIVQTGKQAMEALIAGRADFSSLVITNMAYAGFQSDQLRIIASYGLFFDDAVIFPASSPIQNPADLKGKKIGFAPSTTSQAFLIRLLELQGLSWNDITPVSLQPATGLPALKGGQIDAFVTWQPWRYGIAKALDGKAREIVNNKNIFLRRDFCVSTKTYLNRHPDVPAKLLRALIKAEDFLGKHTDEAVKIIAQKTGQDREAVASYPLQYHIDLSADIPHLVSAYAGWVAKHQDEFLNKPVPDYRKNLAPEYLKAVAPERVEKGM